MRSLGGLRSAAAALLAMTLLGCASAPPEPALHRALRGADLAAVREQARDKAALEERDARGMTPLQAAIFLGRREIALELVGLGADADAITRDGSTPLTLAVDKGYDDVIDRLLAAGARIDPRSDGAGVLFSALRQNRLDLFERFLRAGAKVERRNGVGATVLYVAAERGLWPYAERLLEAGADIDAALPDGRTALHGALLEKQEPFAERLLARGARLASATGEQGTFSSALVQRFAARRAATASDAASASALAARAESTFETLHTQLQARADEYSSQVTKTHLLNVLSIIVGHAGAAVQARTSLSGTGYGHYTVRGTGSLASMRDQYAGLARWSKQEAERMRAAQACLAAATEPPAACLAEPPKEP